MRAYPQWTLEYIRKRLHGGQGWAYYNWALENEVGISGGMLKRKTPGYVNQELWRMLKSQ